MDRGIQQQSGVQSNFAGGRGRDENGTIAQHHRRGAGWLIQSFEPCGQLGHGAGPGFDPVDPDLYPVATKFDVTNGDFDSTFECQTARVVHQIARGAIGLDPYRAVGWDHGQNPPPE